MGRHQRVFLSAAFLFGILFPCPSPVSFTSPLTLFHWLTHSHPSDLIFSERHLLSLERCTFCPVILRVQRCPGDAGAASSATVWGLVSLGRGETTAPAKGLHLLISLPELFFHVSPVSSILVQITINIP